MTGQLVPNLEKTQAALNKATEELRIKGQDLMRKTDVLNNQNELMKAVTEFAKIEQNLVSFEPNSYIKKIGDFF